MIIRIFLILITLISFSKSEDLKSCEWNNKNGNPCITVRKTTNTSEYNSNIKKIIISKKEIEESGATDVVDLLSSIPGLDLKQNGQRGQLTSLFMRGTNSNHTLVMLNGIAINDQSTTQGLHNFGQDFVYTLQQVEIYKGANGVHFGPSAIGGAINFITDINYENSISTNGFDDNNYSTNFNYSKIIENDWHLNLKASLTESNLGSSRFKGTENDGTYNNQFNFNAIKWINDNLKFKSTIYSRHTKADYDGSVSDEIDYKADDKMQAVQAEFNYKKENLENSLIFHHNYYDRFYTGGGYEDTYESNSYVIKAERAVKKNNKTSYGIGSEFKYNDAYFLDNGGWSSPTVKGNNSNFAIFANSGYKFSDDLILSLYARGDDHKTTGLYPTYKVDIIKNYKKIDFNLSTSTGLRNPSLYELYGKNGRSDSYKHVPNPNANPERSQTNELKISYKINKNFSIENTAYRTSIKDALLYDNNLFGGTGYTNNYKDLKQDGIESIINYKGKTQKITLFSTISSSKQTNGAHQLNRPNLTYGLNYLKEIENSLVGNFNLNLNYKHYGKVFDYVGYNIEKVDSTDLINLSLSKKIFNNLFTLNINNLMNENYQRPEGYSQNNRQISLSYRKAFN